MMVKDKIREEMVADSESILEECFERANQNLTLTEDGEVVPDTRHNEWRTRLLIELVGQQYAQRAELVESPGCTYGEMYELVGVDDSTVRSGMNSLRDEGIVSKNEESEEWQVVTRRLPDVLDRIENDDE
jgi:DNA-binding transcriptional ArsR family regulator